MAELPIPPGYVPPEQPINPQVKAELNQWTNGAMSIAGQIQYTSPNDSPLRAEMDVLLQVLHKLKEVINR